MLDNIRKLYSYTLILRMFFKNLRTSTYTVSVSPHNNFTYNPHHDNFSRVSQIFWPPTPQHFHHRSRSLSYIRCFSWRTSRTALLLAIFYHIPYLKTLCQQENWVQIILPLKVFPSQGQSAPKRAVCLFLLNEMLKLFSCALMLRTFVSTEILFGSYFVSGVIKEETF